MTAIYIAHTDSLRDPTRFETAMRAVLPERRAKIDRLLKRDDKILSLGAAVLLQTALTENGVDDHTLTYGENGKPYLVNRPDIYFNLSHSGSMVMCAVSDNEIGCDIQAIGEADLGIAKRFFHPSEYESILQQPTPQEQRRRFYRLWTLKESYIKATGCGLRQSLCRFEIRIDGDDIAAWSQGERLPYYFREYTPQDGYAAAVCATAPIDNGVTVILRNEIG